MLTSPTEYIHALHQCVDEKTIAQLAESGIHNIFDLLLVLPLRYLDKTRITPIAALTHATPALIEAEVISVHSERGRKPSICIALRDIAGDSITMRMYYFGTSMLRTFQPGMRIRCYGDPSPGKTGLEMYHPSYTRLQPGKPAPPLQDRLEPVYPKLGKCTNKVLREAITKALHYCRTHPMGDPIYTQGLDTLELIEALYQVHHPEPEISIGDLEQGTTNAQIRLVVEELTAQQLFMRQHRKNFQQIGAIAFPQQSNKRISTLIEKLPFSLTNAQQRVIAEIAQDLTKKQPMLRLLQGDVGSGKTLVAIIAALQVIQGKAQVALMAPTELLAEQHFTQCHNWLEQLGVRCALIRARERAPTRRDILQSLATGDVDLAVGTHALFQKDVVFSRLGLAIIDEQHRFGVHQRMALRDKGSEQQNNTEKAMQQPHQLIMTATPIPRTLAMTAYADLRSSIIDEMPAGRLAIATRLIAQSRRDRLLHRLRHWCDQGGQAYWVCRLVSESEKLDCESAEQTFAQLRATLRDVRFGLVHGRFARDQKQQVMQAFRDGEIQVLVATTVIEVGVDVPSANLIIIENAEQLGLAQLHQLRGRVGRGIQQAYCMLLHADELGKNAKERLITLRNNNSGFILAEKDLQLRGPGQLLGPRQSGVAKLRIADISKHANQITKAKHIANKIIDKNQQQILIDRWFNKAEGYLAS